MYLKAILQVLNSTIIVIIFWIHFEILSPRIYRRRIVLIMNAPATSKGNKTKLVNI